MTLQELKGKYTRLSHEIDSLAAEGVRNQARLVGLMHDLDQVHCELSELRLLTLNAPTLRDVVDGPVPVPARPVAASMAG
jgi:hypothetical protein